MTELGGFVVLVVLVIGYGAISALRWRLDRRQRQRPPTYVAIKPRRD